MNGYLMLTEARSGSSWLSSLANTMGTVGVSSEWLASKAHGLDTKKMPFSDFCNGVVEKGSSPNGNFGMKIFPAQLLRVRERFGEDFIKRCRSEHDVAFALLRRRDTLRQAISWVRARQTRSFSSKKAASAEAAYDFYEIVRCFFAIRESYAFWQNYLDAGCLPYTDLIYEDLVADISPFAMFLSSHFGVDTSAMHSDLTVQRDDLTEEWVSRFKSEASARDILSASDRTERIPRRMRNIVQFAAGTLKPQRRTA